MHSDVLIIGAGQAGLQTAISLRQGGFEGSITLVGDEPHLPYQRPPLSKTALKGDLGLEAVALRPSAFFDSQSVTCLTGTRADAIDPTARTVQLSDGKTCTYGTLVLATGAPPRQLSVPGMDVLPGKDIAPGKRAVVLGAGYIGLEVAATLRLADANVTVIDLATRCMQRTASPEMSTYFQALHEAHGVTFKFDQAITHIVPSEGNAKAALTLGSGETLEADLLVIGIGVVPDMALAQAAGLTCTNGIAVNAQGQTSDPNIYACGDVALHTHARFDAPIRLESVQSAIDQAKVVAATILDQTAAHDSVPWFWSDQYDAKLQIAGLLGPDAETVVRGDPSTGSFAVWHLRTGHLEAVEAVNAPQDFMRARKLLGQNAAMTTADVVALPYPKARAAE
jgi:3-phenylpropionate/trans-cinnamate dioxygenase ferredoxin reductase subunit